MNMKKFTLTVLRASTHTAYRNPKGITTPVTDFRRPAVGALGLVVSLMALGAAPPAAAQLRYTITDLGTLGDSVSYGTGINNSGQVVGNSNTASGQSHAFRTAANSTINPATDDLGTLGCISAAFGINSAGQVVGHSTQTCFGADPVAFRTAPNSPINSVTDILGGAIATGINDSGQVVGNPNFFFHAFRTAPNSSIKYDLGSLGGFSYATGINNSGQVVGYSSTASGQTHAFRTAPNSPINPATDDLGTLEGSSSSATGINKLGQVVGQSTTASGQTHAFRTAPNSPINPATDDLGAGCATGINNLGQVVGTPAFLYSGAVMYDLNDLIPSGSGWTLGSAGAINDLGQITGTGLVNGVQHAFRLDPEPVVFVSSLRDLLVSFDLPNGISTELSALLRASVDALQRRDNIAAQNQLGAFQNKVNALRGKKLTTTQADILLNAAVMAIQMIT